MKDTLADSHVHDGHRQRMRAKLLVHGQRIFDTYELLEMLLYYVVPYKDTNPIAKRLLSAFGGLDGVLSASEEELVEVNGIGAAAAKFLTLVGAVPNVLGYDILPKCETNFSDYSTVGEYFVNYFKDQNFGGVAALFFDNNMRLLGNERMYDLDFSSGGVKSGKFLDSAIRSRASVVITAHTHPHGSFYPTSGDLATNEAVTEVLGMAGIYHPEHYIISGERFAGISSLKNFAHKFSQCPALGTFASSKAAAMSSEDGCEIFAKNQLCGNWGSSVRNEALELYLKELFSRATRDADEVIKTITTKYRTVEGAMTASISELSEIDGENFACFVKLLAYVSSRRVTDKFSGRKAVLTSLEISSYLKALFLGASVETAYLLCFGEDGRFIDASVIGEGTVNSTDVLPRRALETAIERSASSVALAHNHPFGTPEASTNDVRLTNVMNTAFSACGIRFVGHYIVAGQLCNAIIIKSE